MFSCESGADSDANYALQSTYRYTHQRSYVLRLMQEAGFTDIILEDRVLRQDLGQPVHGFLITATKPSQTVEKSTRRPGIKNTGLVRPLN